MTTTLGASMTQMSAASLSAATQNDPQFRLPAYPCVVPGAVVAWLDDELVIDGTGTRRVLSGKSARRMLPDLLPLLDGRRDLTDLVDALPPGAAVAQVRAVLLLLFSCGLLQDGPMPVEPTDQELLLSRLLDTTRVNTDVGQAQRRLGAATVVVHAPDQVAVVLTRELCSVGIQAVPAASGSVGGPVPDLAVVWTGGDRSAVEGAVARLRRDRTAVLLVGPSTDGLFFGPYSAADHGPCPRCVLDQTPGSHHPVHQDALALLAGLLAVECTALLGRVGSSASVRGQLRLESSPVRTAVHFLAARPGCPLCGDARSAGQDAPAAFTYEASVAFPARRLVNPRDHQHHFEAANIALQFEQATYSDGARTVVLPGADLLELTAGGVPPADGLDLSRLGTILAAAAGSKPAVAGPPGKPARWAPTGGNLASPTIFAVVRDVPGVSPGVWAYQPAGHQLVAVTADLPQLGPDGNGPVSLVLSGALFRVSKKYRTFAYRIVHLDAGVAMCHLALAARRLEVAVCSQPAWPDADLRRALGLSFDTETITGVLHLGGLR